MDFLAPFITSLTTAISVLAAVWIWRRTKRVDTVEFVLAGGIIVYTIYHYFACGIGGVYTNPMHEIITGLFIAGVAIVNAYCSSCRMSNINIGIDRRREDVSCKVLNIKDRRKDDSHVIFKNIGRA